MPLFSDIEMEKLIFAGKKYPKIIIHDHTRIRFVKETTDDTLDNLTEYILLEKFVIPNDDTVLQARMTEALRDSNVLNYLKEFKYPDSIAADIQVDAGGNPTSVPNNFWEKFYNPEGSYKGGLILSPNFHFGGAALNVPAEYIDISSKFTTEKGCNYIVDTGTDTTKNKYLYRIIYALKELGQPVKFVSSKYIAGLSDTDFSDISDTEGNEIDVAKGNGSLYRDSRDGKIVLKGIPIPPMVPRYKGPIEAEKENGVGINFWSVSSYIDTKIKEISNLITKNGGLIYKINHLGTEVIARK